MIAQGITKSNIQLAVERQASLNKFINECLELASVYIIENSTFDFTKGFTRESTNGYLVKVESSDDLSALRKRVSSMSNPAIQIEMDGDKVSYTVGEYFEDVNDAIGTGAKLNEIYSIRSRSALSSL